MPLDQLREEEPDAIKGVEMGFLEHVEVLRWHIIRSLMAIILVSVVSFIFRRTLFHSIILAPTRTDFFTYRILCQLGKKWGYSSLCIEKIDFILQSRELSGQFTMAMLFSFVCGLLIAFPYVFWEIWIFIKPGLHEKEQKVMRGAVFYVSLLFFIGVLFGYYILVPSTIQFFAEFKLDDSIQNLFDITSYISILSTLILCCGIVFEFPVVAFVLAKIGMLSSGFMRTYRKHAYIVILVVGAVITPSTDPLSQMLVSIPLGLLYEISIFLVAWVQKNEKPI